MAIFTLAALATEIATDPLALGYANKNDTLVAALLNLSPQPTPVSGYKNSIPLQQVVQAIVPADLLALTAIQLQQLLFILQFSGGTFDASNANTQTLFGTIFTGKTNTITAFSALATKSLSRAEVLWGSGFSISAAQISQSRNGS
jgi:hypothetical protein